MVKISFILLFLCSFLISIKLNNVEAQAVGQAGTSLLTGLLGGLGNFQSRSKFSNETAKHLRVIFTTPLYGRGIFNKIQTFGNAFRGLAASWGNSNSSQKLNRKFGSTTTAAPTTTKPIAVFNPSGSDGDEDTLSSSNNMNTVSRIDADEKKATITKTNDEKDDDEETSSEKDLSNRIDDEDTVIQSIFSSTVSTTSTGYSYTKNDDSDTTTNAPSSGYDYSKNKTGGYDYSKNENAAKPGYDYSKNDTQSGDISPRIDNAAKPGYDYSKNDTQSGDISPRIDNAAKPGYDYSKNDTQSGYTYNKNDNTAKPGYDYSKNNAQTSDISSRNDNAPKPGYNYSKNNSQSGYTYNRNDNAAKPGYDYSKNNNGNSNVLGNFGTSFPSNNQNNGQALTQGQGYTYDNNRINLPVLSNVANAIGSRSGSPLFSTTTTFGSSNGQQNAQNTGRSGGYSYTRSGDADFETRRRVRRPDQNFAFTFNPIRF